MMKTLLLTLSMLSLYAVGAAQAKEQATKQPADGTALANTALSAEATYLGNEGILIKHSGVKILFDPFFHNDYDTYQLVPEEIRSALFSGTPPYDNIDAIFVSHAHGDHFSAQDLVNYLNTFPTTKLVAPEQAITALSKVDGSDKIADSLVPITLEYKDPPVTGEIGKLRYDVVRIPHAGWPQRAGISNLVFRVTINDRVTVVHMGDADPNDTHFEPLIAHWQKQHSNTAFPPYWFLTSSEGQLILTDRIGADSNIGLHVPVRVPDELKQSQQRYFSTPGERFSIKSE